MAIRSLETDYLVVGAGAMGMAFTDALIDHADVHITLVERRHTAAGHWQDAYPFVRLHQASLFYGVASTVLGSGTLQLTGPEAGLQERARQPEILAYYDDILHRRFIGSGRVTFLGGSEYQAEGSSHLVTSRVSGEIVRVDVRRRVVDTTYLSPTIPATTPPPFGVSDHAHVAAINELPRLTATPNSYVIVGSGKTATDGIVWLLANGVAPDRVVWVRPRDPWMLNRAVVQPDRVRFHSRRARSSCTAPPRACGTHRWFQSGAPTESGSRRSDLASRASPRLWPATSRRPATTTESATDFARPTPSPTTRPTGRECRCGEPSRPATTAPSQTSPRGRTAAP